MTTTQAATAPDRRLEVAAGGSRAEVIASELNQRLQVVSFTGDDLTALGDRLVGEARERGYDKIWAKVDASSRPALEAAGFEVEATIAGYFNGADAHVLSRFLSLERSRSSAGGQQAGILDTIRAQAPDDSLSVLPPGYRPAVATPADAAELAALYSTVFASYPFPIMDPDYLVATMRSHIVYRIVRDGAGALVAAASGETAPALANAEMTDFATLPSQRRLGLAQHLLAALEQDMAERGILNLYTIARARSFGMNRVFFNRGYELTGTLVNNCHIAGRFEDMHVWCRTLPEG